jgi:hypothetical protein
VEDGKMERKLGVGAVFIIILLISIGLVATGNYLMHQQYSFDRHGKLIQDYNQFLKDNGMNGDNLTYMINSGLLIRFNRPIQNDGMVRTSNQSYFLV